MKFLKNALEGLYLLNYSPERSDDHILGNVKFVFTLPLFFMFIGPGLHILLDIPWMNENVASSQVLTFIFGVSFCLTSYPLILKYILPLLDVSKIDHSKKSIKITMYFVYLFACFATMTILAWLTNFTRADEFRQTY